MPKSRRKSPAPLAVGVRAIGAPAIEMGQELKRVIFKGRRGPLTRAQLHRALDAAFASWLSAACTWDDVYIGDHRFVVFSLTVAPRTELFVQFWSEPLDPVLWEVSSGRSHAAAGKWLAGERANRIQAAGFTIAADAANYQRKVPLDSPDDIRLLASEVVDFLYNAFDYRGAADIVARLAAESRSVLRPTFDGFTPEDLSKMLTTVGRRVESAARTSPEDPPLLRYRRRDVWTVVSFDDQVPGHPLFGSATLTCELEALPEELAESPRGETTITVSTTLRFTGGVTLDWIAERLAEWEVMLKARRAQRRKLREVEVSPTVH